MYQAADGTIPVSGFELALDNFKTELASLRRSVRMDEYARVTNASPPSSLPRKRFWFLETVARMPYFSYISCIHLYETLGWWRAAADLRKIHFAEEWNELHHLQIMEALGGDRLWFDRFLGYHAAIAYYWLLEAHAVDTYGEFVDANEELLKELEPPLVAVQYYRSPDLYMFDEFQTDISNGQRDPKCDSLYDVFANIRDDEGEHVKTMHACQDAEIMDEIVERREKMRRV
ncbi:hypothetical protein DUNSADRAFT_8722 [Dunaliella salina]|uniref:Ubiquinol oxidase n=1 Tax=Dunaliella salina TaxID=3046 RepID=A0ABQ7GIX5_DUNSA|nr:hypothetical protein DUNSADRAFT_8722 [Dunaliella salina]|eukprot:KAF5834555.1 hypothetical protein DUNSADRAFT_8722 [Dunaliella salina]